MSLREEQCKKVCRILDDVLANRPTERDSLIVATRNAFKALAEPEIGKWINVVDGIEYTWANCDKCGARIPMAYKYYNFCPHCGEKKEVTDGRF